MELVSLKKNVYSFSIHPRFNRGILEMSYNPSNFQIALATHYYIYSASQAFRDFLRLKKSMKLFYIAHPLYLKDVKSKDKSFAEFSAGSRVIKRLTTNIRFNSILVSSIFEFFLLISWIFRTRQVYDLYIGVDNLNAIQGLILKKLGKVKKVVFYTIDYFPTRFENKFLNWIYHTIDRICVENADETWNVSSKMDAARERIYKVSQKARNRQYEVPIGIWYNHTRPKNFTEIDRRKLIFVGHLLPYMGVDLVIKTLPILVKDIKGVKLEIIGDGEERENLIRLAKKLGVGDKVKFYGWIRERKRLEEVISDGAVGLATFNTKILDEKVKNADPGKIKDYMQVGMPVITTNAVSTADRIVKAEAGVLIEYDSNQLRRAVAKLLKNEEVLKKYRQNALAYVKSFDYPVIFKPNIERALNSKL